MLQATRNRSVGQDAVRYVMICFEEELNTIPQTKGPLSMKALNFETALVSPNEMHCTVKINYNIEILEKCVLTFSIQWNKMRLELENGGFSSELPSKEKHFSRNFKITY